MTDTGSFMFQGTNENTFALARELVLAARIRRTARAGSTLRTPSPRFVCSGEALRNLNVEGHIGYAWVTQKQMERCGAIEEDCEGLVNYVLRLAASKWPRSSASCPTADTA